MVDQARWGLAPAIHVCAASRVQLSSLPQWHVYRFSVQGAVGWPRASERPWVTNGMVSIQRNERPICISARCGAELSMALRLWALGPLQGCVRRHLGAACASRPPVSIGRLPKSCVDFLGSE